MLQVFLPYKTLEDAIREVKPAVDLLPVLHSLYDPNCGLQVYDAPENWTNEDNLVFCYAKNEGISIHNCTSFICEIKQNHDKVLEYPCGMFVLDISNEEANQIQSDYGVICQTNNTINTEFLCTSNEDEFLKDDTASWKEVLSIIEGQPSNSLLIVDRYLFCNPHYKGEPILNILNILNNVIPRNLKIPYHVAILTGISPDGKYDGFNFGDFKEIWSNYILKHLNREFPITLEIIAIKDNEYFREIAHNRRIFSNYYFIKAEHGFVAFSSGSNKSLFEQAIELRGTLSNGVKSNKHHSKKLKQIKQYLQYQSQLDNNLYSIDGNVIRFPEFIKNRLINKAVLNKHFT